MTARAEPGEDPRAFRTLTSHFLHALFDFGILSEAAADSFKRLLVSSIGAFVATGLFLTRVYAGRYEALRGGASPEPYRRAVLGDDLLLIGLPMLLVAFVTLLISDSLFPDERDFRILGPLPVRRTTVFAAKLAALLIFTASFIVIVHLALVPLKLLTSFSRWSPHSVVWRLITWIIAGGAASTFAVLAIAALVGTLVLVLSRSRLQSLTAIMRSAAFAVLVVSVPFVFRLPTLGAAVANGSTWLTFVPPVWFLGLERTLVGDANPWFARLATIAVAVAAVAVGSVAIAYAVLFRHFERLILRATKAPRGFRTEGARARVRLPPPFRAVYQFTAATLRRSQLHQGVLVGISACGAGLVINRLAGVNAGWLLAGGAAHAALTGAALWMPFVLMCACGVALRAALALPMEYRANWIFRLTEADATRLDQLCGVERLVAIYVVGVPVAISSPLLWLALGSNAAIAVPVVVLIGFVFVHAVLLHWRRIPFTCSYLPGKRFLAHTLVLATIAYSLFTIIAVALVRTAMSDARRAVIIIAALAIVAAVLRRRRRAVWTVTPLMFEDELPEYPLQLQL